MTKRKSNQRHLQHGGHPPCCSFLTRMNDTPETDIEAYNIQKWPDGSYEMDGCEDGQHVDVNFARKLECERNAAQAQVVMLRDVVQWIADQSDLFFAECSQAEEIIVRCRQALSIPPPEVVTKAHHDAVVKEAAAVAFAAGWDMGIANTYFAAAPDLEEALRQHMEPTPEKP